LLSVSISYAEFGTSKTFVFIPPGGLSCAPSGIIRTIQAGQSNATNITFQELNATFDQNYTVNFTTSSGIPGVWVTFSGQNISVPNTPSFNNTTATITVPSGFSGDFSGYIYVNSSLLSRGNCTIPLNVTVIAPPTPPPPPGGGGGGIITPPPPTVPVVLDTAVQIQPGSDQVVGGNRVYALITIQRGGGPVQAINVNLTYSIKDPDGKVIDFKKATEAVENIRSDIFFLTVPPNSPLGVYTYEALVTYDNASDTATDNFQVISRLPLALLSIKEIDVPLMFQDDKGRIIVILDNQADNPLTVNVTMFYPEDFEPKTDSQQRIINGLSEEVFDFGVTPHAFGVFSGFISIKYDGRGFTRDFTINVYPSFIKYGWIIVLILLLILIVVIIYRRRKKERYPQDRLARLRLLVRR